MPLSLKVTDRATIFATHLSGNSLLRSVIKATADDPTRPPLKHVQRILFSSLFGAFGETSRIAPPKVYEYLLERLAIRDSWLVVCKTLLILHMILKEGNSQLFELLLEDSAAWSWAADHLLGPDFVYAQFVRKYALYLREMVIAYKTLQAVFYQPKEGTRARHAPKNHNIGADSRQLQATVREQKRLVSSSGSSMALSSARDGPYRNYTEISPHTSKQADIRSLSIGDTIRAMSVLQNQLDALVAVHLDDESLQNDVTCAVIELVGAELVPLFSQITDGMYRVLDVFPTFETQHAIFCLRLYDRYCKAVQLAQSFMNTLNTVSFFSLEGKRSLPGHVPLDLSASLREYVLQKGLEKANSLGSKESRLQEESAILKAIEDSIRESS
jgi:hypothetical protein